MTNKALMLSTLVASLIFSSCGDKKDQPGRQGVQQTGSAAENRVSGLGFVAQLPADTQWLGAVYEPTRLCQSLRNTYLARTIFHFFQSEQNKAAQIPTLKDLAAPLPASKDMEELLPLLGEEIVFGQYGEIQPVLNSWGELITTLTGSMGMGISCEETGKEPSEADLAKMKAAAEKIQMIPGIIALKNSPEAYNSLKTKLAEKILDWNKSVDGLSLAEEQFAGAVFSGIKIEGTKLAESLLKEDGKISKNQTLKTLISSLLTGKNAYLLMGRVGNYTVCFSVQDPAQMKLAESPDQSVGGSPEFAFIDQYAGKKPVTVGFATQDIIKTALENYRNYNAAHTASMFRAIDTVLPMLGVTDTNKISDSFKALTDKLTAAENFSYKVDSALGWFGQKDKGYKFDIWGISAASMDMKTPLAMAPRFNSSDAILYYELNSSEEYAKICWDLLDQIGDTAVVLMDAAATSQAIKENPSYGMILNMVKPALIDLGKNYKKLFAQGLDKNVALTITPGEGSIPVNLSYLSPVIDKNSVIEGWTGMRKAVNGLGAATLGTNWDASLPTISKEELNTPGGTSAFYACSPLPKLDFISPAAALNNKMLVTGTSVAAVKKLAMMPEPIPTGNEPKGTIFSIRMEPLTRLMAQTAEKKQDMKEASDLLQMLGKDFKSIEAGVENIDGKTKATFHIITE